MKPLEDIRVLSVTVFLAGPFLSMSLARFGADVIKIEMPGTGDPIRNIAPYAGPDGITPARQTEDDLSIRLLKRAEGMKSVTLNLRDPDGKRMFLDLAKQSDVVVENLSPGSMKRLGLGYEDVSKINPGIIYCSISGYGQTGPNKDLPAHDHQIQAMSGIMDMNGDPDRPPTRVGFFVGDTVTPLFAAYSILGALRHREKTGEGQFLDASMIDSLAALLFMEPMEYVIREGLPVRNGNNSRNSVTGLYRLSDGDVIITVGTQPRWESLCKALGGEELLTDPRYATAKDRETHVEELRGKIQTLLAPLHCAEAVPLLEAAGIPVAQVRTLADVIGDKHFQERGTLKPMYRPGSDDPVEDGIVPGFPVTFSGGPLPELPIGPKLGQHNEDVYGRLLGLDPAALTDLKSRGVI